MDTISNVTVEIAVVIGTTQMPIHQLLRMGRGAVIELDASEDAPVEILANNVPIARGQVMLRGDRISVNVIEVLQRSSSFRPRELIGLLG